MQVCTRRLMFGMRAFQAGVQVVVGAYLFAFFLAVGDMAETVIAEWAGVAPAALGLSIVAFFG